MILLTGATGFVGGSLARVLLKRGRGLRCLVRSPEKPPAKALKELGVELATGDVTDPETILEAIDSKIDAAIHLVGILREERGRTFRSLHVDATRNVVAALKERGVKRYVHMSALGAREGAVSPYHRTKWAAEEIIRASGLDYTIIRPSVIFGAEDKFTNMFAPLIRLLPFIVLPGSGRGRMQPVFVEDVAGAIAFAAEDAEAAGEAFELGGPESFSFDEIIDMIADAVGRRVVKLHVPTGLMLPAVAVLEAVLSRPPLTRSELTMLEEDNVTYDTRLFKMAGIAPTGFRDGMGRYLK